MKVEVIKETGQYKREVYGFNLFDLTAVFVTYHREIKLEGKRKWKISEFWDKYSRDSNIIEPDLPMEIRKEARDIVKEMILVNTWAEYKRL